MDDNKKKVLSEAEKIARKEYRFHEHIRIGDEKWVRRMMDEDPGLVHLQTKRFTALHMAVLYDQWQIMQILLEAGADARVKSKEGIMNDQVTASELADYYQRMEMAAYLKSVEKVLNEKQTLSEIELVSDHCDQNPSDGVLIPSGVKSRPRL